MVQSFPREQLNHRPGRSYTGPIAERRRERGRWRMIEAPIHGRQARMTSAAGEEEWRPKPQERIKR